MATTSSFLHLRHGEIPTLIAVFEVGDPARVMASVALGGGVSAILSPRALRVYADALVEVADEACRREDALTDEPLPISFADIVRAAR